jgi:thiol-disulfide isomerase/thioredoxin
MWQRWVFVLGVLGVCWSNLAARCAAKDVRPLEIGAAAPDFALPGVDGKTHRLADFADAKVLVVVFTCNHCPTAQAYETRLIQLEADYRNRGVRLVAISPNDALALRLDEMGYTDVGDSLADMKIRAKDRGFQFPYLYDGEKQTVSAAYGALATPHVFIFDANRRLRYQGRIDDSDVGVVKSHDTRNAIDALLAGKPVPVPTTRVFGCSTKWSDKRETVVQSLAKWNAEEVTLQDIDEAGVRKLVQNDTPNLRLINVWATWCGPCVAEFPELVTINRMYRKRRFELITISLDGKDDRDQALKRLREGHVSATNYQCSTADRDKLAESLDKDWRGPLPYTILVAPGGKILYRKHDALEPAAVKRAIVEHLGRTYATR